jgi:hypothetical protein
MRARDRAGDSTPRNTDGFDPVASFLALVGVALPVALLAALVVALLLFGPIP